jgi:hypothetical protein
MELFVVMVNDRHTDNAAYPFSTKAAALAFARNTAEGWLVEAPNPPTDWLYYAEHSIQEDSIWVERKFLDEPHRKE